MLYVLQTFIYFERKKIKRKKTVRGIKELGFSDSIRVSRILLAFFNKNGGAVSSGQYL